MVDNQNCPGRGFFVFWGQGVKSYLFKNQYYGEKSCLHEQFKKVILRKLRETADYTIKNRKICGVISKKDRITEKTYKSMSKKQKKFSVN